MPDFETRHASLTRALAAWSDGKPGTVRPRELTAALEAQGLDPRRDARLDALARALDGTDPNAERPVAQLLDGLPEVPLSLMERALAGDLAIRDFESFEREMRDIHDGLVPDLSGEPADYIPALSKMDPDAFAVAGCTVDGQRFAFGDADTPFTVQSVHKPVAYALAQDHAGVSAVHRHVGREPSGRRFNELTLNDFGRPHNPMLNAGAIMCGTLIAPGEPRSDRLDALAGAWKRLTGGAEPGFDEEVFESEKAHADRNFALAYFMREQQAFPPDTDVSEALDFYFRACSMTLDVRALAVMAASFANRGCCPLTSRRTVDPDVARNVLSIMYTCGMYNLAGEFAFSVGLPAKSGVSGGLVLVVPGVAGFAVWSPRLDRVGNTARGVGFARALVERFPFHHFETVHDCRPDASARAGDLATFQLLTAARLGDVGEIRRLYAGGADLAAADYEGRTALHVAARAGSTAAVAYLLAKGADAGLRDGDGFTPLERARDAGSEEASRLLASA